MDTNELEIAVRDNLFEYQTDPISSEYIVRKLNEAYRFAYNTFVKESDTHFGEVYDLAIMAGQSAYPLPTGMWNKRIEHLQVPSPPNQSVDPWGYLKIPKIDFKQTYRYQTKRIRTYYPVCWSQLNNTIYLYPPPLIGFTAKLIISRDLTPLGRYGGRIFDLGADTITIETKDVDGVPTFYDDRLEANAGNGDTGFISVNDGDTGEIKALFPYSNAVAATGVITLTTPEINRTKYLGKTITALPGGNWSTLGVELDDYVTFGVATSLSIFGGWLDTFLTDWATMKIRGAMNETDPEVTNSLKLQLKELMGDLGGRPLGVKIARVTSNNWGSRPYRR